MDFMEGLLRLEGKDIIMIIVDRFTQYGHSIALAHPFTTQDIAKLFIDHIYKFYRQG